MEVTKVLRQIQACGCRQGGWHLLLTTVGDESGTLCGYLATIVGTPLSYGFLSKCLRAEHVRATVFALPRSTPTRSPLLCQCERLTIVWRKHCSPNASS